MNVNQDPELWQTVDAEYSLLLDWSAGTASETLQQPSWPAQQQNGLTHVVAGTLKVRVAGVRSRGRVHSTLDGFSHL